MHIGFILDGNGRWASNRGLPRAFGHKKGAENVEIILRECIGLDIKHVTLYAFSTENWNRPVYEVKALMNLFKYYLNKKLTQLHEENVNVSIIGDIEPFPKIIKKYIQNLVDLTKDNNGMYLKRFIRAFTSYTGLFQFSVEKAYRVTCFISKPMHSLSMISTFSAPFL